MVGSPSAIVAPAAAGRGTCEPWPGPSLCGFDLAAVVGDDAIGDRQPQAGPLARRGGG